MLSSSDFFRYNTQDKKMIEFNIHQFEISVQKIRFFVCNLVKNMTKTGLTFIAQNVYYLGLSFVTCPAYKHRNITRRYIYPTKNCENRKHSLISKNLKWYEFESTFKNSNCVAGGKKKKMRDFEILLYWMFHPAPFFAETYKQYLCRH